MVEGIVALFVFDDFSDDLYDLVVVGPLRGHEFGGDEYVIDIYFEGADPREDDILVGGFVQEYIFLAAELIGFDELVRDWIFDNNGVGYEFFDFALH